MARELTELEKKLRQMALEDWPQFVQVIGEEALLSAKICILRSKGKSYGKIALTLKVTPRVAQIRSEKCACNTLLEDKKANVSC